MRAGAKGLAEQPETVSELVLALATGGITAEAVANGLLDRIADKEVAIGAFEHLDSEQFLAEARRRDRTPRRSPLHGIPIAVKDIFDTADMPTTYGSRIYEGFRPRADAAAVAIARAAGAVVMGKTVTTEFAGTAPGKTRNPCNLEHTPGGSSSGSAAAVAAGMALLALGTQTAGSVIRPASYCGVVGYKPTFGRIDRTGAKTLAQSCDTVGVIAGNVPDAALFAAVLAGRPVIGLAEPAARVRIGIYRTAMADRSSPESMAALDVAALAAERSGADVRERAVWVREPTLFAAHQTILAWEVPHAMSHERLCHFDILQSKTRELVGGEMPAAETVDLARRDWLAGIAGIDSLFQDCDALLTLAAPGAAPAGLDSTGDATFNRVWSLLGVPCVTVPAIQTCAGLPVGVQVVARPMADDLALSIAALLERALDGRGCHN
jgi:Asp-tRNA(Asn)/Glu-tRNA(Gln) amidotransferase A subunit family amidase